MSQQFVYDYSQEPKQDILCIDSKSFFASVECVERGLDPLTAELVVMSRAEAKGGLVLAASPRVKEKYGLKTGSRSFEFPKRHTIKIVPPRMGLYIEKNLSINRIFQKYVAPQDIHIYSIDESFLDVSFSHKLFGSNYQIARQIQRDIYQELGLTVCVGIGDNMLLAKLALDFKAKNNPPYIAYWSYQRVPQTLWQIENLTDFWGIGKRTAKRLNAMGIETIYQLAHADSKYLQQEFGIIGLELRQHANGIDHSVINEAYSPKSKSYGHSQILPRDYYKQKEVEAVILEMADKVGARLRSHDKEAGQISVGIGYSDQVAVKGFSRQTKIYPTARTDLLQDETIRLFRKFYEPYPVRRVSVSAGKVMPKLDTQFNLFEDPDKTLNYEQLDHIVDQIRAAYGYDSLMYGVSATEGATAVDRSKLIGGHQAE